MFIYLIRNRESGKCYVGQTVRHFDRRMRQHRVDGARNARNYPITNAIHKYGWGAFDKTPLEVCETQEQLDLAEIHWIKHYNCLAPNGYNIALGGRGGKMSEETKAKLRIRSMGRRLSEGAKAKIATARLGSKASQETRERMSNSQPSDGSNNAKLNWSKVAEIRRRRHSGETLMSLAKAFDVSANCIMAVATAQTWADQELEFVVTKRPIRVLALNDAIDIVARRKSGESGVSLAKEYEISTAMVCEIFKGKKWPEAQK